jgi:hypothetical protein
MEHSTCKKVAVCSISDSGFLHTWFHIFIGLRRTGTTGSSPRISLLQILRHMSATARPCCRATAVKTSALASASGNRIVEGLPLLTSKHRLHRHHARAWPWVRSLRLLFEDGRTTETEQNPHGGPISAYLVLDRCQGS